MASYCVEAVPRPGFRFIIPLLQRQMGIVLYIPALLRMVTGKYIRGSDLGKNTELQFM